MKKLLALIIIFLLLLFAGRGWWNNQGGSVSDDKVTRTVIIAKGASVDDIANQLQKEGLIKSPLIFKLLVKQKNMGEKIQAGTFKLSPAMSIEEVINALSGGAVEVWVTLIEGWRVEEMAQELSENLPAGKAGLKVKSEKFLTLAQEGYMFPDTYLFPNEITEEQIVKMMRDHFDKKYSDDLKAKIRSKGLSEKEGVILASIVEREARSDKVRTEVAGILLKRLSIDMGLNADATIQYALGYQTDEKSWWKRHLTRDDLKVDSPYNTYIHRGLPPTPICNPSLSSLEAVANTDPSTPYLYYYHDSKGNSHYGKTLEEHNENVANNP